MLNIVEILCDNRLEINGEDIAMDNVTLCIEQGLLSMDGADFKTCAKT